MGKSPIDLEIERLRINEEKDKEKRNDRFAVRFFISLFAISVILSTIAVTDWTDFRARRMLNKCQEYCASTDFENAHIYCDKLYAFCQYNEECWNYYYLADEVLFLSESQYLVSHFNVNNSIDKICYLLTSLPVMGEYQPNGTMLPYYEIEDVEKYASWVQRYNQKCDALFSLAIGLNNEELARRILLLYKDELSFQENKKKQGILQYKVCETSNAKSAAKKRFNEAFKTM